MNSRIELTDTLMDIATKMCEGNVGALTVVMNLVKDGDAIDPDAALGGLMAVLDLDTLGIYGSHIWILFKDVCGGSLPHLMALLRANQLGFINGEKVVAASQSKGDKIDVDDLMRQVKARLPDFAKDFAV